VRVVPLLRPKGREDGRIQTKSDSPAFRRTDILCRDPYWNGGHPCSLYIGKTKVQRSDWYYPATMLQPVLNKYQVGLIREVLPPGSVRLGYGDLSVHLRQESRVLKLDSNSWPSIHDRPAWPSTPTFNEWLEMVRYGETPSFQVYDNATVALSLRQFNADAELAKRIIRRQVVGVRSDIAVPEKFWGYFRYRWNFLILTSPTALPIGLARFLAGLWCSDPHSLWLERKVSLKQYLRQVPRSALRRPKPLSVPEPMSNISSRPESPLTSDDEIGFDPWSNMDSVSMCSSQDL
jgi:hypothetical protein